MHNEPASRAPRTTNNNHIQQRKKKRIEIKHTEKKGEPGIRFFIHHPERK